MLWVFWLILMILIAATPSIYLLVEQRRSGAACADPNDGEAPATR